MPAGDIYGTRYTRGIAIRDDFVTPFGERRWLVLSSDEQRRYRVARLQKKCRHNMCSEEERDMCLHKYKCSCYDEVNPCKHIYKVHSMEYPPALPSIVPQNLRSQLYSLTEELWVLIGRNNLTVRQAKKLRRGLQVLLTPQALN